MTSGVSSISFSDPLGMSSFTAAHSPQRQRLCTINSLCSTVRLKSEIKSHWLSCFAAFSHCVSHRHISVLDTPGAWPAVAS